MCEYFSYVASLYDNFTQVSLVFLLNQLFHESASELINLNENVYCVYFVVYYLHISLKYIIFKYKQINYSFILIGIII